MTNNDILRRVRFIFDFNDAKVIGVFAQADCQVTREDVSSWLKKDEDPDYKSCSDSQIATFLNGLINDKRGKKEGAQPEPEKKINNNIVLRKLKIALNLHNDELLRLMKDGGLNISSHELSAFFRRIGHKHYRVCKDQVLRNFLRGLQYRHRPETKRDEIDNEGGT
ncbi:MAG: hypothetical protein A6F71_01065 [Cycloclasticus sp. symbiont of Poecilosclerida sp. M]|nr:MAG: hypothetical protein A6F71_01065 [Cycloclasticus sp. symbiont of Poecilosclerida sp. M]